MGLKRIALIGLCAAAVSCAQPVDYVEWTPESHPAILEQCSEPQVVQTPMGPAWSFDGVDDAFYFDSVPTAGLDELTVEVIFRQSSDAAFEQRFLHIGSMDNRILFETRVNPDSSWYFDAFVRLGKEKEQSAVLIDPQLCHPCDVWYALAFVLSKNGLASYVDGVEQKRSELAFAPLINEGCTSVGVRQNKRCWFKGEILKIRFTPRALDPYEFVYVEK